MSKEKLTKTQRTILEIMRDHDGLCVFSHSDRKGTRLYGYGQFTGLPQIAAYMSPELFMKRRGLIKPAGGNYTPYVYRITDAGLAAIAPKKETP